MWFVIVDLYDASPIGSTKSGHPVKGLTREVLKPNGGVGARRYLKRVSRYTSDHLEKTTNLLR